MNAKALSMGIVGVILAVGIIGGVNALQKSSILITFSSTERSPTTASTSLNGASTFASSSSSSSTTGKNEATATSPAPSNDTTGLLAVQLTDPPNVPSGVSHVYLNYSEIDVHIAGVGMSSGWYAVANSSVVDLMTLVNVSLTLGSAPVSSGWFTSVKFDLNSVVVTYQGQNYPAKVFVNHLTVPIDYGGVRISPNGSAGVLVDLSPTIVPVAAATANSTSSSSSPSFLLVPNARSIPILDRFWTPSVLVKGDRDYRNWWNSFLQNSTGSVSLQSTSLSPDSLSVSVLNTGSTPVSLTGIAILAPFYNASMSSAHSGTESEQQEDLYRNLVPVAVFEILSNGELVQPISALEEPMGSFGYSLGSGQSVTLSYSSTISTLGLVLGNSSSWSSSINSGSSYVISVLGSCPAVSAQVRAS